MFASGHPESASYWVGGGVPGCEGRRPDQLDPAEHSGEASTVMTTLDGYPMARQGLLCRLVAVGVELLFHRCVRSPYCGMALFAPLLREAAIAFGIVDSDRWCPQSSAAWPAHRSMQTLIAAPSGLFVHGRHRRQQRRGTVSTATDRLTDGITVALLGCSISEIIVKPYRGKEVIKSHAHDVQVQPARRSWCPASRCAGSIMGVLLVLGATWPSAVAYMTEKRRGQDYGQGARGPRGRPPSWCGMRKRWCRC
ncbi:tripartite tricarboxylate transporter permease [Pseudomonas sp. GG8]